MGTHTGTRISSSGSNVRTLADLSSHKKPTAEHIKPRKLIEEIGPVPSYGSGVLGGIKPKPSSQAELRQATYARYDPKGARYDRYAANLDEMRRRELQHEMTRVGLKYHKSSGNKLVGEMRKELLQKYKQKPELFSSP
jgi:hypothetical protein